MDRSRLRELWTSLVERPEKTRTSRGVPAPHAPLSDAELAQVIAAVREARLTYCGRPKMENLARAAQQVIADKVQGDFLEAGVALGGSAIVLARVKEPTRRLDLYDVFEMIPPPGDRDGEDAHRRYKEISSGASKGLGPDKYYGYTENLIDVVRQNLVRFGADPTECRVSFRPGLFEDTLQIRRPVALAHIDCDWYDSVKVCVDRILPNLSVGGVIAFDDYSSYSGCQKFVDQLLAEHPELKVIYKERSLGLRRT